MATQKKPVTKKAPVTSKKKSITEEDIRKRAEKIYNNRIAKGIPGNPESDWKQAEDELKRS